ncbi:Phenylalanine--tRNA ligase beta subunit [Buchnera aphidicola (Eriosoma grossulariae)]|uniref:phenylalanine--tRNA ligase subunit beta n=1 Tax=Buchnera aphidicola TaxID=9 RepID=UPI003463B29C
MKFSEEWLRELINPSISIIDICDQMTKSGLEIENIEPISGAFSGIVVGEILSCTLHPDVNNLFILTLNIGLKKDISIVCSALNCRVGIKVAVALLGAVLPSSFCITSRIIKGFLSEGMLCSFKELNMVSFDNNIIELPIYAEIGKNIRHFFSNKENIISVSVNPNRPDELGMIGIAREVAVLNNLKLPVIPSTNLVLTTNNFLPIHISQNVNCMRYFGRILKNIDIQQQSPFWLKEKLRRSNFSSKGLITDMINYCMIMFGQLFHVFDADKILHSIIVRNSSSLDKCILPDNSSIDLDENLVVIVDDSNNILSIHGVMNTKFSTVTKDTKNIFLGCIYFPLDSISISSMLFQLNYDFSYRFNKGIDLAAQYDVMDFITNLLLDIFGGKPGPIIDKFMNRNLFFIRNHIILHQKKIYTILGYKIENRICSSILCQLGYTIVFENQDYWDLIVPTWRFDIKIEEDVISDIMRIYGYDQKCSIPIKENSAIVKINKMNLFLNRIKFLLVDKGYHEVITYGFVDPKIQKLLYPDQIPLLISNPISQDMSSMRLSLWPGLITSVLYNQKRQQQSIRFFEVGLCFSSDCGYELNIKQENHLSGIISGECCLPHWDMMNKRFDFYDLKGDLESILEINDNLNHISFKSEILDGLHPGKSAGIYFFKKRIGCIGVLHPMIHKKLNLNDTVIMFNILYDQLNDISKLKVLNFSKLPIIKRDISIIINEDIYVGDIVFVCKNAISNQNLEVDILDIYRNQEIGHGKKSIAIRLTFYNIKKTLTEKEIIFMLDKCLLDLKNKFKAIFRNKFDGSK